MIRIRNIGRIQPRRDGLRRNIVMCDSARRNIRHQALYSAGDFIARAIIEGNDQREPGISHRQRFRFFKKAANVFGQAFTLTNNPNPDIFPMQVRQIAP